jgi:hypothetical protein
LSQHEENLSTASKQDTKRSFLEVAAKIFDPLGLFSPFTMKVKEKINTDQIEQWISNNNKEMKELMINHIMSVAAGSSDFWQPPPLFLCLLNLNVKAAK